MASNVCQAYKTELKEFVKKDDLLTHDSIKTRLLEAHKAVKRINAIAPRNICAELQADILQSLVKIYRDEQNEPEVQEYLASLSELTDALQVVDETPASINIEIAESMTVTSRELIKLTDDLDKDLEEPLLSSSWLFKDTKDPYPPLHRALLDGRAGVSEILAKDPNARVACDFLKRMAIHVAVQCGNATFVKTHLLDTPGSRNERDVLKRTAIFEVAAHGDLEMLEQLIAGDKGVIHVRDQDGATLMDHLAAGGHTACGRFLLTQGFDVAVPGLGTSSPLHTAADRGFTEFCDLLLENGADAMYLIRYNGFQDTPARVAYRKSCIVESEIEKLHFYSLALRIAEAEKPPFSASWIAERERARIDSMQTVEDGGRTSIIPRLDRQR